MNERIIDCFVNFEITTCISYNNFNVQIPILFNSVNYLVFYLPKIVLVRLVNYADLHDENGGWSQTDGSIS